MKLFLGTLFLLLFIFPSSAFAAKKSCSLKSQFFYAQIEKKAQEIEQSAKPWDRWRAFDQAPEMDKVLVRKMLLVTWRAFGFKGQSLHKRINLNMEQIKVDSSYKPHLKGLFLDQTVVPEAGTPGGLFAFFDADYSKWNNHRGWRGPQSKFNPLGNIFAAVNAQVQGKRIFSGQGRISLPRKNFCSFS